jgi:hypothetical protein
MMGRLERHLDRDVIGRLNADAKAVGMAKLRHGWYRRLIAKAEWENRYLTERGEPVRVWAVTS